MEEKKIQAAFFIGVVENRVDPNELGRVQVRAIGIHTADKTELPTKDLPWAIPIQDITSPATSGIGKSPTGIVEGAWVVGMFLDSQAQQPVIFGTIAGRPSQQFNKGMGFSDPNEKYPIEDSAWHTITDSDVSMLARRTAEDHPVLLNKREQKEKLGHVKIAKGAAVDSVQNTDAKDETFFGQAVGTIEKAKAWFLGIFGKEKEEGDKENRTWQEPNPRYGGEEIGQYTNGETSSLYPLNHVWFTEAGHAFEVDDTPNAERIHQYHKSGTFSEVQHDGTRVNKVVAKDYNIVLDDENIAITGNCNITVIGNVHLKAKNFVAEIDDDYILNIGGDYIKKVGGNESKEISSDQSIHVAKNRNYVVDLDKKESSNNYYDIQKTDLFVVSGNTSSYDATNEAAFKAGNSAAFEAGNNVTVTAGNKLDIGANTGGTFTVQGDLVFTTNSNHIVTVSGTLTEAVTGAVTETYGDTVATTVAQDVTQTYNNAHSVVTTTTAHSGTIDAATEVKAGETKILLTTHTHDQGDDDDGSVEETTDAPNAT